jgi:lipoprotein-releasing system ATP-binding protein
MSDFILQLDGVCKSFPLGNGSYLPVLKNINFKLKLGERVAVVGSSGCGKSTLLNVMGTLDLADAGKVLLNNREVSGQTDKELADLRLREIGFVFQKHHLMPQLTALENVLVPTLKHSSIALNERALMLMEKVGLADRRNHRPGQLSGGECQRVALCRALINSPKLLLADEPTGALDGASSTNLTDILLKLNEEEKMALVTVTHSAELATSIGQVYRFQSGNLELS